MLELLWRKLLFHCMCTFVNRTPVSNNFKMTHKEQHTNVTVVVVVEEYTVVAISIPQMTTIWRFMVNGYYYYVPSEKSM